MLQIQQFGWVFRQTVLDMELFCRIWVPWYSNLVVQQWHYEWAKHRFVNCSVIVLEECCWDIFLNINNGLTCSFSGWCYGECWTSCIYINFWPKSYDGSGNILKLFWLFFYAFRRSLISSSFVSILIDFPQTNHEQPFPFQSGTSLGTTPVGTAEVTRNINVRIRTGDHPFWTF